MFFFKIVLILQVQLMSTEQTKAHAKGKWQKAQVLNQNFCFWVFSNYLKSSGLSVRSMYMPAIYSVGIRDLLLNGNVEIQLVCVQESP